MQILNSSGPTKQQLAQERMRFWKEVGPAIQKIVVTSFREQGMNHPTEHEVARRVDICKDLAKTMRYDYKWSIPRIRDQIQTGLRLKLIGLDYDFDAADKRSSW